MKPFLLLGSREDQAARDEVESIRRHLGVRADELLKVQLTDETLPDVNLDDWSGVILGGGPFNASEPNPSLLQQRMEAYLGRVIDEVLEREFPFMGICYGVGVLTTRLGGVVAPTSSKPVQAIEVRLTDEGRADPLLEGIPDVFKAFVAHKEACRVPPAEAVLLGLGEDCPVQMYRVGRHCYITQFHPELDADDLATRIRLYENAGYFHPDEMADLIRNAHAAGLAGFQHQILTNFASRYGR